MFGKGSNRQRFASRLAVAALAATVALLLLAPSQASQVPGDGDLPHAPDAPAVPHVPELPGALPLGSDVDPGETAGERINGGSGDEEEPQPILPPRAKAVADEATQAVAELDLQAIIDDLLVDLPQPDVNDVPLPDVGDPAMLIGSGQQQQPSTAASTQTASRAIVDRATPATIIASAALATGILLAWATKTGTLGAASVVAGSNLAQAEAGRRVIPSPLFTRFQRETVLNHPKRGELYQLIADKPGICLQSLCDDTELSRTAVTHHLRLLEKQHLIVSKRNGRSRHYYQNGGRYGTEMKQAYAVLQNERSQAIAEFIHGHPGAIQKSICNRLGIDASVAHWHAKRLEEANLIRTVRQGRTVAYFPSAPLDQIRQSAT